MIKYLRLIKKRGAIRNCNLAGNHEVHEALRKYILFQLDLERFFN